MKGSFVTSLLKGFYESAKETENMIDPFHNRQLVITVAQFFCKNDLRFEFAERAAGNGKKLDEFFFACSGGTLSNVAGN